MDFVEQVRAQATQLLEALGEGWAKLVAASGQALTRFARRAPDQTVSESWGVLAGEIFETPTHVIVRLEAPGMEKEEFDIQVLGRALVIRGDKRFERAEETGNSLLLETAYGTFERSLPLPRDVDAERAEAGYRRGVLTVKLPKTEPGNARKVPVG
jgi:HSP20 family protein